MFWRTSDPSVMHQPAHQLSKEAYIISPTYFLLSMKLSHIHISKQVHKYI